jgi:hypothetical protein
MVVNRDWSYVKKYIPLTLLLLGVSIFYIYTLAPSLNWADGARMQLDVMFGGSTYWSFDEARHVSTDGLPFDKLGVAAWDHPVYVMLAQVFRKLPLSEPLYQINLMSAFFGVLAVATVYKLGMVLTGDPIAASLGALALAVSHTFWFHSVTSEAYTLHMFLMALIILFTMHWSVTQNWRDLLYMAILAGLGLANHVMMALTLLPVGVYVILVYVYYNTDYFRRRFSHSQKEHPITTRRSLAIYLLILVLAFFIGFAPWWIQFIRMARIIGLPLVIQIATGLPWLGHRFQISSFSTTLLNIIGYLAWLLFQFTPVGVALGIYGFWKMFRSRIDLALLFLSLLAIHVAFSANYSLADQFNFHLPSYLVFSLGMIMGIAELRQIISRHSYFNSVGWRVFFTAFITLLILAPIGVYATAPTLLRTLGYTEERVNIPPIGTGVRDAFDVFLNPNSRGDDSASRFARSTLDQLAPGALVLTPKSSDQETYVVLRYVQLIEGVRPDIHLELMLFDPLDDVREGILEMILAQQACSPIYLASLNPQVYPLEEIKHMFEIVPEANLYKLIPRVAAETPGNCPQVTEAWAGIPFDEMIRLAMRWR